MHQNLVDLYTCLAFLCLEVQLVGLGLLQVLLTFGILLLMIVILLLH